MDLNEIYYVDEKRLSHYVDQIERSPKTSDKGSKFKIELGWPPKLGWEQTRDVRDRTTTEKIEIVRNYLEKTEQCSWRRPDREEEWSPFVLEYVRVTKVIVPSSAEKALNTPGFIFWLAVGSEEDCGGTLCLLEDFRRADEPPTNFRSASTYTVLQSLVYFAREQLRSTVMSLHIPDEPHPNPYAKFDGKPPSLAEYHNVKDYAWQFVTNPVQLLREWGCAISPSRDVEVLYRIREFGRDASHHWERVTVFGYPIWIREGTAQRIV